MLGRIVFVSVVVLCLVQTSRSLGYGATSGMANGQVPQQNGYGAAAASNNGAFKGYGASSGAANGQMPQNNGKPQNGGGIGRMLMPSKGVGQALGSQTGYGGYPNKPAGYGAATSGVANGQQPNGYGAGAGVNNGNVKGYGAAGAMNKGQGSKPQGYGGQAGLTNGPQTKGNGFGAQAGALGGQPSKGNGYGVPSAALGATGNRGNKGPMNGLGRTGFLGGSSRPYGQKSAGSSGVNGARHNGAGGQPMKGYGKPSYGSGPGVGGGATRGMGVPQLANNQGKAFGGNGYGARPMGGYNGGTGYGRGPQVGNGGMKGPKQGYGASAGASNGQRANAGYGFAAASRPTKPIYGNKPNGYGAKATGFGAARGGYGAGALPTGYGAKPNGYGAQPNGNGQGGKHGAALGGAGGKPNGYGAASQGPQSQVTKGAVSGQGSKSLGAGFGIMPQGHGSNGAGMYNGKGLKGGDQSPQQPSYAAAQGATQQGYPQGKPYKQPQMIPQATPAQAAMFPTGPTARPALVSLQGMGLRESTSGPVVPFGDPSSGPAAHPQGFLTGDAVPEQTGAEGDDVLGVGSNIEGHDVPEGTSTSQTNVDPETLTHERKEATEETAEVTEGIKEYPSNLPVAGPQRPGVKGGSSGAAGVSGNGKGSMISKGQGVNPDCGPSGIPNGQWMKIPRPAHNGAAGASLGGNNKGLGAGAGGPNRFGAKSNGNGAGAYPALNNGYGAGHGYPFGGKPNQPNFGQGNYPGAGYGNPAAGNAGTGETMKSKPGYGNGFGVQPDYASLGPKTPSGNGNAGMGQFGPNGKSNKYGGMGTSPFAGQNGKGQMRSNAKYGIGGLQFGGASPTGNNGGVTYGYGAGAFNPTNGAKSTGNYGAATMGGNPAAGQHGQWFGGFPNGGQHLGLGSDANTPGKYGYGRLPHDPQAAAQQPQAKSAGKYGQSGSQFQAESVGFVQQGKSKSSYAKQGSFQQQLHESVSEMAPSPATAVEGDGMLAERYDDAGYINGKMQPGAAAFPAATTSSSFFTHPSAASYQPAESSFTPDAVHGAADDLSDLSDLSHQLGTATASESLSEAQEREQPDDQQELPRQIHIQQHLKLHFHPQGAKDEKYDLNGFLGNSGFQG